VAIIRAADMEELLDDIGLPRGVKRNKTREYLTEAMKECDDLLSRCDIEFLAAAFCDGYLAARQGTKPKRSPALAIR
jgi:hypothetical protein